MRAARLNFLILNAHRLSVLLVGGFLALIAAAPVCAHPHQNVPPGMSGFFGFVTDYVDRGVSQSNGKQALQGGVKWQHSGSAYVELWGSTVDFDDGDETSAEINYILGIQREVGSTQLDLNIAYIHYPGAAANLHYDLVEVGASVNRTLAIFDLTGHAIFTPSNSGSSGQALYVAMEASKDLAEAVNLRAHVGRQWHERNTIAGPNYHDWGLALQWGGDHLKVALSFSDTDGSDCADLCDARLAASLEISF